MNLTACLATREEAIGYEEKEPLVACLYSISSCDKLNRMEVASCRTQQGATLTQDHANGSSAMAMVSNIELSTYGEVADLHYLLGKLLEQADRK